jgi:uncharacterized protein
MNLKKALQVTIFGFGLAFGGAFIGSKITPVAQAQQNTDPKIAAIQRFFDAYAKNDLNGIRAVLADDIKWTIPGHHPLSGTKQGIPEVMSFFQQLGRMEFKSEPFFFGAQGDLVVDIHRGYSTKGVGKVDTNWALVWRFNKDNKVTEVFNLTGDQHQMDAFIWANYQLKSLPDRLK